MALTKDKGAAFLSSATHSIRHLDFFHWASYLKLTLEGLIHSTFSMLTVTSLNGDIILFTLHSALFPACHTNSNLKVNFLA
jgi:hypothetical protein